MGEKIPLRASTANLEAQLKDAVNVLLAFGTLYIIEPVAFYPMIGNSGSYMGWLVGSVANTRLPASVTAKNVIGVEDNTEESEIVSTAAIAGSVIVTIVVLSIGALVGVQIVNALPEVVMKTLTSYIVPVIVGSVLAMLGGDRLIITIPTFLVLLGLNLLAENGIIDIPYWVMLLVCVVGSVVYTRILYKKGKV